MHHTARGFDIPIAFLLQHLVGNVCITSDVAQELPVEAAQMLCVAGLLITEDDDRRAVQEFAACMNPQVM